MSIKLCKLVSAALLFAAAPAQAAVLSGQITGGSAFGKGIFEKLDPMAGGFSVGEDNFNTPNLYAFDERQNFTLTRDLAANLGLTNIAIGTRVNSHFVFFDPLARETLQGDVAFDTPVLAAITLRRQLIDSNYLGAPSVTYLRPASYGLEPGTDFVTLSGSAIRINFFTTDSPGDHFRVITAAPIISAIPEPAQWAQLIMGFAFVGGLMRAFRARRAKLA